MATEQKTLAELSKEVKEKRYVTLEVGSKISGYTLEYLERLCRLDKLEHRLSRKGFFVIELQSLLRETHTLLISDEEINFVDEREFAPLSPPQIPTTPSPIPPVEEVKRESVPATPVALPVVRLSDTLATPIAPIAPPLYGDEWEQLLFGGVGDVSGAKPQAVSVSSLYQVPSVYRPVATSVDPLPHRDNAPLFPSIQKNISPVPSSASPAPQAPAPLIPPFVRIPVPVSPPPLAGASPPLPQIAEEHHLVVPASHELLRE